MKKIIFTLFLAIMATTGLYAQQISVVSSGGTTSLYRTLQEAIEGAEPGSVIYLPGGGFPISDDVKITKKLTIIGIGHYIKSGNIDNNVDGVTTITGNLFFNEGSSGSAVMGCYFTGSIRIGHDGKAVNDIMIKYSNLFEVTVHNSNCMKTIVNQCYIRNGGAFGNANVELSNNIIKNINDISNGIIKNNIITESWDYYALNKVYSTIIQNNILLQRNTGIHRGADCQISNNMFCREWGEDCINIGDTDWNDIFVNFNNGAISPTSDFHFKESYKQYENKVGVYANGTDFDKQLAPVPYIVAKQIPEQTDAQGKLNIKIRVKAGQ